MYGWIGPGLSYMPGQSLLRYILMKDDGVAMDSIIGMELSYGAQQPHRRLELLLHALKTLARISSR